MYTSLATPTIRTSRLLIRFVDISDVNDYFEMCSDSEVCKYLTFNPYKNVKDCEKTINNMIRARILGSDVNFTILDKESKTVLGTISLSFHENDNDVEIGYLLKRKYWHQGYMDEALKPMIDVAFNHYNANRINANYVSENISSERLLLKNGFKVESIKRYGFKKNLRNYDLVYTYLQKNDYLLK